jgi:HEAT repeat protein
MESILVYSTLSDPFLVVAFWTGIGALALTLLLGAEIVFLRIKLRRSERLEKKAVAKWRPILNAALFEDKIENLPRLAARERIAFLRLWVHLHESVRGGASKSLNDVAYRLGCDAFARRLLAKGNRAEKLLAVLALGHLRNAQAWPALLKQAGVSDSVTSLYALWGLVQIDGKLAAECMTPFFIERDDWALSRVVTILLDAREQCEEVLIRLLPGLDAGRLPRALRIVEGLRVNLPPPLLSDLLRRDAVDVMIGALRITSSPVLLDEVRALASHPDWQVRVQVAKTVGRLGGPGEVDVLQRLLTDSQWWVRYRAAHALVTLPFLDKAALAAIAEGCDDRFAADMLRQVQEEGVAV